MSSAKPAAARRTTPSDRLSFPTNCWARRSGSSSTHTNCGMELISDEIMAYLLDDDLATASFDGKKWSNPHHKGGHAAGHFIKWHTINNQEASVAQDVRRIREHPLVPHNVPIYGYVYDVKTDRLNEVKTTTEAGKAPAAWCVNRLFARLVGTRLAATFGFAISVRKVIE